MAYNPEFMLPLTQLNDFFKALIFKPDVVPAAAAAISQLSLQLAQKTAAQRWHWARGPVSTLVTTLH